MKAPAKGHRTHGSNHRLTLNKQGPLKPVERGRRNNKMLWAEGTAYEHGVGTTGNKLFKKIRSKKRRMLPVDEVPGI